MRFVELVAAAVSAISNCEFCANAHGLCAQAAGMQAAMKVIQQKDPSLIADEHAREVIEWTLNVFKPNMRIIKNPPMTKEDAPELIGTVFATIYMNVITHNFVSDRAMPPNLPRFLRLAYEKDGAFKSIVDKVAAKVLKKKSAPPDEMNKVFKLLPREFEEIKVEIPEDMNWVNGNDFIKKNMKFWCWAMGIHCDAIVPRSLRNFLTDFMMNEYMCQEIDKAPEEWASEIISKSPHGKFIIENDDLVWAELMLIVAADPVKLHACEVLQKFKKQNPDECGEKKLKAGVIFAAFVRARRVCSFLGGSIRNTPNQNVSAFIKTAH